MPLFDTGDRVPNAATMGKNARTLDENNKTVIVEATAEAIQDYGWETIISVASEKYDNRDLASEGSPPRVCVTTGDCANA